jgi:hypothetical protein
MKIYFAWVDEGETFNPILHARRDEDIFDLEITENEGDFPMAYVRIRNPYCGFLHPSRKQNAFISQGTRQSNSQEKVILLFKGHLVAVPELNQEETLKLAFIAEPSNSQELLNDLHQKLKVPPHWDNLCLREESQNEPNESLEGRSALFYWCRVTGNVSLSSIMEGKNLLHLKKNFYFDSLKVKISNFPLTGIKVILKAEWMQSLEGKVNLMRLIKSRFPKGIINTFTGPDLKAKWWRKGEKLGKSGYWVEESYLEEFKPHYTGNLNVYPSYSEPYWISPYDPLARKKEPAKVKLKRYWLKGKLVLGWRYHQHRQEYLSFFLKHNYQNFLNNQQRIKTIELHLQDVTKVFPSQKTRASFFLTTRGVQVFEHALERACAYLAASARAIDITFKGPFERLSQLTCDHSVILCHPHLPGGKAEGKIKALKLCIEGKTGKSWAEVTLGTCVGVGKEKNEKELHSINSPPYAEEDYVDTSYTLDFFGERRTSCGISYESWEDQPPKKGLKYLYSLGGEKIIREFEIRYGPEEQQQYLKDNQFPSRHNLKQVLKEMKTEINLKLLSLKTYPKHKHVINAKLLSAWSAPCHIDLRAGK